MTSRKGIRTIGMTFLASICLVVGTARTEITHNRRVEQSEARISIPLMENAGQWSPEVRFGARTFAGSAFITSDGAITYALSAAAVGQPQPGMIIRESLINGSTDLTGENPSATNVSYFLGSESARWATTIPAYESISFGQVYPGISLQLKAYSNNIEKVFCVSPGSDPENIRINVAGVDRLSIDHTGQLVFHGESGDLIMTQPAAYQEFETSRTEVEVAYSIDGHTYGFRLGEYDETRPLIIDPLLAATYFGGTDEEGWIYSGMIDNAVDNDGNVLVAGMTVAIDFPSLSGAYECPACSNQDLFVAKFDPSLTELLAVAVIGGGNNERQPHIEIATNGSIFLAGQSFSTNYPTTPGAFQSSNSGNGDVVISRFDAGLTTLQASTYIGGISAEEFPSMDLDSSDNVFVGGITSHNSYPTVPGSYRTWLAGENDYFISKLSGDLTTLVASTFIGGTYGERWGSIGVTSSDDVVIAGTTASPDYPSTTGVYDETFNGVPPYGEYNMDMIVSKFDNNLTTLLASTFIGSDDFDGGGLMTLDSAGNVYLGGHTESVDYPTTTGAFDEIHNGINEFHISKLSADLTTLLASTYLTPDRTGNDGFIYCTDMIVDYSGNLILTGAAWDIHTYTTPNAYDRSFNGGENDVVVNVLTGDLTTSLYSTYLGGSGGEGDASAVPGEDGSIFVAAYTSSADFPIPTDAVQSTHAGGEKDCVVARLTPDQFTEITVGPHVTDTYRSSGISWVDYDADDYLDLYISNAGYPTDECNCLYRNGGDGTFSRIEGLEIVNDYNFSTAGIWADFDNDNDLDLFVASHRTHANILYENDGAGVFAVNTSTPVDDDTVGSTTTGWVDYDIDGNLDLFVGNATCGSCPEYPPYRNFLFHNIAGTFSEVSSGDIVTVEKHTYGATWCDYDNDGDPDLVAPSNMDELTDFYRNDGAGNFTLMPSSSVSQSVTNGGCSSWSDYDNDGDMDLFIANFSPGPSYLYTNNGDGSFSEVSNHNIGMSDGRASEGIWGDFDNDGDEDIFVWLIDYTNVNPSEGNIFENLGDGTFSRITDGALAEDTCTTTAAGWGDYDRDGDLDLYLANYDPTNTGDTVSLRNQLFRNNGNSNNWFIVKPIGTVSNRSAIGAKVRLLATVGGAPLWQMREITSQTASGTQPPLEAHFGLGDASSIDSIIVEWPSGILQQFADVSVNQFLIIEESCCVSMTGNVDGDPGELVDIGDLTALISYLYIPPNEQPTCMKEANVDGDGDGVVDIGDLTALIAYLYIPPNFEPADCK